MYIINIILQDSPVLSSNEMSDLEQFMTVQLRQNNLKLKYTCITRIDTEIMSQQDIVICYFDNFNCRIKNVIICIVIVILS